MSEAAKADADVLTLHTRPRGVRRFNRRVLIGLSAVGCALLVGATMLALHPLGLRQGNTGKELYNTDQKPKAEGLAELPRTYADIPKQVPALGPPLNGDMGRPVVDAERSLGIAPTQEPGFRPDPEAERLRAERIRLAQKAEQAHESGVFFQINAKRDPVQPVAAGQTTQTVTTTPHVGGVPDGTRLTIDTQKDQNLQQRKLDFFNQSVDRNI